MEKSSSVNQKKLLINGTLVLMLAAIITKVLSAVYRVPFQNIVGDVGFYIYQQIYPFYGIAIALATTGFPVILSKFFAEQNSKSTTGKSNKLLIPSFIVIFLFCLAIFLFLNLGAGSIANSMGDKELTPLIQIVSFSFLLVPFISVSRGIFQGHGNMVPTAISQVGEQTVRVILILVFAILLVVNGYSLYSVGKSAILASVIGSIFSAGVLVFFLLKRGMLQHQKLNISHILPVMRPLLIQGIAVCISGLTLVLFQLSDAFQVYSLLVEQGVHEETAKVLKGIYDRGQPILQFGLIAATAISLSVVPIISSVNSKENNKELIDYSQLAVKVSMTIGAAATVGLILIMDPLNIMLFENLLGTEVLRVLALAVFFGSINACIIAILQGIGHTIYPAFIVIIGLGIKIIFNGIWIPMFGVVGSALSTVLALLFMLLIFRRKLRRTIGSRLLHKGFIGHLLYSLGIMAMVIFALFIIMNFAIPLGDSRLGASIQAILLAGVGGFVFVFFIIRSGVFTEDELSILPLGNKLKTFLKKKS